jgi:nitroimidazol reductase NimA-like FMN-containing flavoprotein (pyridoxamine 5'-phosphate oxidase superfamily)
MTPDVPIDEAAGKDGHELDDAHVEEGFEQIPSDRCMSLLREGAVGLLALVGTDAPDLRPVNFSLHRQQIVMRTGRGRIFESARRGSAAAFVISEYDRFEHSGWSVVVKGRLSIGDPSDSAIRTRVRPWATSDKQEWVMLSIEQVTGREIERGTAT